ncbi:MAG TPA: translation initiation factor IF-3 [Candidatus Pacebacteria bacterium]|nr:translation initiation factor IF-3 [Candidatus Paceibacterota bacterium]
MLRKKTKRHQPTRIFVQANQMIRFPQVRVLSERGEFLGVMSSVEAQNLARGEEKDLVLVTDKAEMPITKIIELSKFKYQLQQKEAEGRKKARSQDTKEVRFSPFIGENDLNGKINKVMGFLQKGHKVKLTLIFKGRQMANKDQGFVIIKRVIEAATDISDVELPPRLMGNKLMTQLMPAKKKKLVESAGTVAATAPKSATPLPSITPQPATLKKVA